MSEVWMTCDGEIFQVVWDITSLSFVKTRQQLILALEFAGCELLGVL